MSAEPAGRTVSASIFAALLWCLGTALVVASRVLPSLRAQITRPLVLEISSDDGVARRWRFDPQRRRIMTGSAGDSPSNALRFATSRQGIRALLSPAAVDRIVNGYLRGTIRFDGSGNGKGLEFGTRDADDAAAATTLPVDWQFAQPLPW